MEPLTNADKRDLLTWAHAVVVSGRELSESWGLLLEDLAEESGDTHAGASQTFLESLAGHSAEELREMFWSLSQATAPKSCLECTSRS